MGFIYHKVCAIPYLLQRRSNSVDVKFIQFGARGFKIELRPGEGGGESWRSLKCWVRLFSLFLSEGFLDLFCKLGKERRN